MAERDQQAEPERTSLDDETPGSQGEIESGSEGDFTGAGVSDEVLAKDEEPQAED